MRFIGNSVLRFVLVLTGALAVTASVASAAPITKALTLQVFQLCDDSGNDCASLGPAGDTYYATEVNAIWAQAGIGVDFSFVQQINSTWFSDIDDSVSGRGFSDLAAAYGTHGPSGVLVDVFLVHTIAGAYGEGWVGAGGLVAGMDDILAFHSGDPAYPRGRIDSIAHELGHNFGLVSNSDPESDGSGHSINPDELMAPGGIRNVPGTVADINPNGLQWDLISDYQINGTRRSSLLEDVAIPEPATVAIFASGLLALVAIRRRSA